MIILKEFLQSNLVNAIRCTAEDLYQIKIKLKETFTKHFCIQKFFPWIY